VVNSFSVKNQIVISNVEILGPGICVDEDACFLEFYAVVVGNWLPTFRVVLCLHLHGHAVQDSN